MEVTQSENVKVPNSVLVGGLTGDVIYNEIMEYLGEIGSIVPLYIVSAGQRNVLSLYLNMFFLFDKCCLVQK